MPTWTPCRSSRPTVVEVQTEALGLSAEEMEQLITVPLEQDLLNGVAWMDSIRSQSVPGLSSIVMEFEPGTDLYRARQVVQERLNEAHALPNVAKVPAMLQPQSSTSRAMMISLSSEELTPIQLGVLARWTIVPRLTGVPGVSNVVIWGQKERQLQVLVDPERLAGTGVTLDQVISTTGNALWASPLIVPRGVDARARVGSSTRTTSGSACSTSRRSRPPTSWPGWPSRARGTPGHEHGAAPLRLGDVADVVEDHQPLIGDAVVDGGEGLILVVEKLPDTSTTAVTAGNRGRARVDGARPRRRRRRHRHLPAGDLPRRTRGATWSARSSSGPSCSWSGSWPSSSAGAVRSSASSPSPSRCWRRSWCSTCGRRPSTPSSSPAWSWRSPPWSTTPSSSVDSVGRAPRSADGDDASAADGAATSRRPAGWHRSAVILGVRRALETRGPWASRWRRWCVALLPLFVLEGLAGDSFYPPLAISFLIAVVVSMLVAVTVTPALALVLLPRKAVGASRNPRSSAGCGRAYRRVAGTASSDADPVVMLAGAAVIAAGRGVFLALDRSVLPPLKETDLLIAWNGPPSASLPEMDRITARAAEELRGLEGVRNVDAHVGRAIHGDHVGGANTGEIWVSLDPARRLRRDRQRHRGRSSTATPVSTARC